LHTLDPGHRGTAIHSRPRYIRDAICGPGNWPVTVPICKHRPSINGTKPLYIVIQIIIIIIPVPAASWLAVQIAPERHGPGNDYPMLVIKFHLTKLEHVKKY